MYDVRSTPRAPLYSCAFLVQSAHENRIYSLRLVCDASYPDRPPTVHFLSRINLPCVNSQNGRVRIAQSLDDAVTLMPRRALRSIPPGSLFWPTGGGITLSKRFFRSFASAFLCPSSISFFLFGALSSHACTHREMASAANRKLAQPPEGSMF